VDRKIGDNLKNLKMEVKNMFRIAEGPSRTFWVAGNGTGTYYIGQLQSYLAANAAATPGTIVPLAVPAGAADTTNKQIPAGIAVGFNSRVQTSNSGGQYSTAVVSSANQLARDWMFQEGMYVKGDPQLLIQLAEILPETIIEGDIRNAAIGTAPTLLTVSASTDADGMISVGVTTNATQFTPVAHKCTIYCRSGRNAGLYRVTKDTSTTVPQVTTAFPYNVAVGDTFVRVPFKQGFSGVYIGYGVPGMAVDSAIEDAANTNFSVMIYKMDLSVALKETVQFRFATTHFDVLRV